MATSKARATRVAATALDTGTGTPPAMQGIMGLVLDVNGRSVTINSGDIANLKTNGIDMGITEPVDVGLFSDIVTYINTTFGVSIPTDASNLPEPLATVVPKVLGLRVTILKAHIKIPGTASPDQNKYYTMVMSMLEDKGDLASITLPGGGTLGIKGAVLGVTNEAISTS